MKQVKITIILDQPLMGKHTEEVTRAILGDPMAYGRYPSFSQDKVTVEEIDTDEEVVTCVRAEELYPLKELQNKFESDADSLTPQENALLFKNMDRQVSYMRGVREAGKK